MGKTFYFYDLETTGVNPRDGRVMQFAGQRVDLNLQPIGSPHNYMIRLTEDILPDPDAVLITGITPQQTIADGLTEAEFLQIFMREIAIPNTIFVGFNTVRFDDEFMRFMLYRNFYDPYEWQWKDGRSRWDLLDVVRMTRALRPDGINWPVDSNGKATNRLELITQRNNLDHQHAHDALSDVLATIAVAKLIKSRQPKLFGYLLDMRDKKTAAALASQHTPFVYTSGKYDAACEKTTVVIKLADHPKKQGILVYDLRLDPTPFLAMSVAELVKAWTWNKEPTAPRLPVKTLQFNRCPAIAPLAVLDEASWQRIHLTETTVQKNLTRLSTDDQFIQRLYAALESLDKAQQLRILDDAAEVDGQLYDAFIPDSDKPKMAVIRAAHDQALPNVTLQFTDKRLEALVPLYVARNYPKLLSTELRQQWEAYRQRTLLGGQTNSRAARYFKRLHELASQTNLTDEKRYLLEELQLYGQAILPTETLST
ncbi:MAG: exodeoxyribonuclease I [Candidatus Saccharimonadales bacterium]